MSNFQSSAPIANYLIRLKTIKWYQAPHRSKKGNLNISLDKLMTGSWTYFCTGWWLEVGQIGVQVLVIYYVQSGHLLVRDVTPSYVLKIICVRLMVSYLGSDVYYYCICTIGYCICVELNIVFHGTVPCCLVQYCIVYIFHGTIWCCMKQYGIVEYCI